MRKPLLFLDVDGPLNPFAAKPHRRPEGYTTHRVLTPQWVRSERRNLPPGKRVKPLRVWLNPKHGAELLKLDYEVIWATTWEDPNVWIGPRIGLPELNAVAWPDGYEDLPKTGDLGINWKTRSLLAYAEGRPFAWVDDDIQQADRDLVRDQYPTPALLHQINPRVGLTDDDFTLLADWALQQTGSVAHD